MLTLSEIAILRGRAITTGMIVEPWANKLLDTVEQLYHDRSESRELVTAMSCGTPGAAEQAFDLVRKWFQETLDGGGR